MSRFQKFSRCARCRNFEIRGGRARGSGNTEISLLPPKVWSVGSGATLRTFFRKFRIRVIIRKLEGDSAAQLWDPG